MSILAIDAGTGSVRAVIFSLSGEQLAVAGREWRHPADPRYPGSMNFDFAANWPLITESIREALSKAGLSGSDIKAVSATSMREGFVVYDSSGRELWACANVDARAGSQVSELRDQSADLETRAYHASGQTFALSAQPRLRWLSQHEPDLYAKIHTIGMISDWILTKLSGEFASEPSNACSTGIFDLAARQWSMELARDCGLSESIFPKILEPGTVLGGVTSRASAETGLAEGTAVVVGGGDAQLGALGLGVVNPADTAIVGGSFWQQMVNLDGLKTDPDMRIRIDAHVIADLWQAEGIVFNPGIAIRWFRDSFGQSEKKEAKRRNLDPYDVLTERAAEVPAGSFGVIPIFSDTMNYAKWIHAAPSFLNLSLDSSRSGTAVLFRSLLENAAIVSKSHIDIISSFSGTKPESIVFAGGAAKSPLWSQIVADVLQLPLRIPIVKESTALGTALCAAFALGEYLSLAEAGSSVSGWERTVEPNSSNAAVYEDLQHRWTAAYRSQLQLVREGITTPMWRAAGV